MADGQGQAPQIDTGEPRPSVEAAQGQGPPEQGGGDPGHAAHWCYQCNKEVVVEPEQDGVAGSMVCSECQSGFVEALATAQTVPDVRRAQRRRRRRGTTAAAVVAGTSPGAAAAARNIVPLSEALEHLYPQQLMQVLQMLGQATNRSNSPAPGSQEQENAETVQPRNTAVESQTPVPVQDGTATASQNTVQDLPAGEVRVEGQEGRVERPEGEDRAATPATTAEALERLTQEGHMLFISGASPGNEEDADEDLVVSDTESEEGMRLEFDAWDSADEDEEEWEEVDEDEEAAATGGEEGGAGEEHETEPQEGEQPEEQQGEERPHRREFRLRTRNMEHNLHQYLQELLQNLVGQNVEVRVEMPNGPLYVGNPGDYVDARGFEQLLQQMAENDNSRRGAPPAAKTAVDCLPSISIEQRHLEDGTAVCAICKDVVALGEPAKQLPCFHLYHNDCILPWLGSRNSCPVCRYELPTDDPDYEEQKQSRSGTVQNTTSQSPSSGAEVAEGQDNSNVGGNVVQNTLGQDQNATDANVEAGQMVGASTSETYAQQVVSTGGEQEHNQSASDRSLLPGPETANTNPLRSSNEGGENVRGENESDEVGRGEALRGTGRGWFLLAAAPVLSMMGLVLVLCLGNHFMGGRMHHLRTPLQRQQNQFFQEPHVEQIGGASDVQGRRRWWMPFQR